MTLACSPNPSRRSAPNSLKLFLLLFMVLLVSISNPNGLIYNYDLDWYASKLSLSLRRAFSRAFPSTVTGTCCLAISTLAASRVPRRLCAQGASPFGNWGCALTGLVSLKISPSLVVALDDGGAGCVRRWETRTTVAFNWEAEIIELISTAVVILSNHLVLIYRFQRRIRAHRCGGSWGNRGNREQRWRLSYL